MTDRTRKVKPKQVDPEVLKLAEGEIAIKFIEHPELEGKVRERVSDLIENRGGRKLIESQDAIRYLTKAVGSDLASLLCSVDPKEFQTFGRKTNPKVPTALQARNIAAAYVIVDILRSALSLSAVQDWLTSYSDYLYGIPAVEIHRRPEDVRMAALNMITDGDEPNMPPSW